MLVLVFPTPGGTKHHRTSALVSSEHGPPYIILARVSTVNNGEYEWYVAWLWGILSGGPKLSEYWVQK
jgi:hypothetical protein